MPTLVATKGTAVYGASDDLVEFDGEYSGEVGCYGTDERDTGVLLIFSDGTLLEAKYGKFDEGTWEVKVVAKGSLLDRVDYAPIGSNNDQIHSDIVYFKPGIKFAFAATDWQKVK